MIAAAIDEQESAVGLSLLLPGDFATPRQNARFEYIKILG